MSTSTPNYNLLKPDGTEFVDEATQLNSNWDIVDAVMKDNADDIAAEVTARGAADTSIEARLDAIEAAWEDWTPVFSGSTGAVTLGNSVLEGRKKVIGKTVHFTISFTVGSTFSPGTGQLRFSLPETETTDVRWCFQGTWRSVGSSTTWPLWFERTSAGVLTWKYHDVEDNFPGELGVFTFAVYTLTTGDIYTVQGTYEMV